MKVVCTDFFAPVVLLSTLRLLCRFSQDRFTEFVLTTELLIAVIDRLLGKVFDGDFLVMVPIWRNCLYYDKLLGFESNTPLLFRLGTTFADCSGLFGLDLYYDC